MLTFDAGSLLRCADCTQVSLNRLLMDCGSGWQSGLTMPLSHWSWRIRISRTLLYNVEQWFHIQNKLSSHGYAFKNTFTSVTYSSRYATLYRKRRLNQATMSLCRTNAFLDAIKRIMGGLVKDFTQGGEDKLDGIRNTHGRARAEAISRRFPTATTRVRAQVRSCGICGGQSGTGVGFLPVLRFPLQIFIPPIAPQSRSSIIWGYNWAPPDYEIRSVYTHVALS
jgi:hypothetical protein